MRSRLRHQSGSALGEKLIAWAVMTLYLGLLAIAFSRSLAAGFALIGLTVAVFAAVFAFGISRDRRKARGRMAQCRQNLEQAAATRGAALDSIFLGEGEIATSGFGIAGAARQLFYAHNGYGKPDLVVIGFGDLAAAFARPDGAGYRLEIRTRGDGRMMLWLRVDGREEAGRWVDGMKACLGDRARWVEAGETLATR